MHKLMEYVCNELEELERKAAKEGKLSAAEIEYIDKLTHIKKNILRAEEMWEDSEYSEAGGSYYEGGNSNREGGNSNRRSMRGSYARGRGRNARRDSMGRYSRYGGNSYGNEDMVEQLEELMESAPENVKNDLQRIITKVENM